MNQKFTAFSQRGHSTDILLKHLMQDSVESEERFKERRKKALMVKVKSNSNDRIVALEIPFTPRTPSLSTALSVSALQRQIESASPALSRAALGKLTLCNLKTSNIKEACIPRGYIRSTSNRNEDEVINKIEQADKQASIDHDLRDEQHQDLESEL